MRMMQFSVLSKNSVCADRIMSVRKTIEGFEQGSRRAWMQFWISTMPGFLACKCIFYILGRNLPFVLLNSEAIRPSSRVTAAAEPIC